MKIELHLHTNRYSLCAVDSPETMMQALIDRGYHATFLTEHNTFWSPEEIDELARRFPPLRIFPGAELSVGDEDLLVLGTSDPKYLAMRDGQEILCAARRDGLVTILAHPFRWETSRRLLQGSLLPDAMEALTPNQTGRAAKRARREADRLGLSAVHSSDAHSVSMLGRYWIETRDEIASAEELGDCLREGGYELCAAEEEASSA